MNSGPCDLANMHPVWTNLLRSSSTSIVYCEIVNHEIAQSFIRKIYINKCVYIYNLSGKWLD